VTTGSTCCALGSTVCPKKTKTGNVPSAKIGSNLSEGAEEGRGEEREGGLDAAARGFG